MSDKKKQIEQMIRPNCRGFEPYVAGKPVETIQRELGLKKVIKLASNENPLGPSKKAVKAMKSAARKVFFYPDSNSWALKQKIAENFRVKPANILLGAGSDEIIEIIAKLFFNQADEVVVSEHAFIRYKMAGELMNCKVVSVPMKGFKHDLDAMARAVNSRTKAVFIANPNNPTGTYNTKGELERFLSSVSVKSLSLPPLVVMDEAYYEYALVNRDYPRTLGLLKKYPNLVILRTFSKIYGLAGLRVGYGFADETVVDYYERVRPPFNVNLMAQRAATASLNDKRQVKRSVSMAEAQKKWLCGELGKLDIEYVPSAANFILMEIRPFSGRYVFQKLLRLGVIVRAMDEYDYPGFVRVTVGLPSENRMFIGAVKKLIKK
ncbi:MAG: histidinol-phosphate transaminase [Endomicrobiales bacterium]|nr:histidinol-phosphate transaminase [Endomicrobiales bacterium]